MFSKKEISKTEKVGQCIKRMATYSIFSSFRSIKLLPTEPEPELGYL